MGHIRARDRVALDPAKTPAEGFDRKIGTRRLVVTVRPLHRKKHAARLHERQAQLGEDIELRHRAADREIERFTQRGQLLDPPPQRGHALQSEGTTGTFDKIDLFPHAVNSCQLYLRPQDLQNDPREAGAGAYVDHAPGAKIRKRQERRAVQKMQPRHARRVSDRGEVRDRIRLQKQPPVFAKLPDLFFRRLDAERRQSLAYDAFHNPPQGKRICHTAYPLFYLYNIAHRRDSIKPLS